MISEVKDVVRKLWLPSQLQGAEKDYLSDLCFVIFSLLKASNVREYLLVTTLGNKVRAHIQHHGHHSS